MRSITTEATELLLLHLSELINQQKQIMNEQTEQPEGRRLKIISISPSTILEFLALSRNTPPQFLALPDCHFPANAKVISINSNWEYHSIDLMVESSDFELVPAGERPPREYAMEQFNVIDLKEVAASFIEREKAIQQEEERHRQWVEKQRQLQQDLESL